MRLLKFVTKPRPFLWAVILSCGVAAAVIHAFPYRGF